MTREEIEKIQIDDVLYNEENNIPVVVKSQWSDDKEEILDDDYLSLEFLNGNYGQGIRMGDFKKWHRVEDSSPLEVRYSVLQERFFKLESFVYSRLN